MIHNKNTKNDFLENCLLKLIKLLYRFCCWLGTDWWCWCCQGM